MFGVVLIFVNLPGGALIYSVLGLVIFTVWPNDHADQPIMGSLIACDRWPVRITDLGSI